MRSEASKIFGGNDQASFRQGFQAAVIHNAIKIGIEGPSIRTKTMTSSTSAKKNLTKLVQKIGASALEVGGGRGVYDPVFRREDQSIFGMINRLFYGSNAKGGGLTRGRSMILYNDYSSAAHEWTHYRLQFRLQGVNFYAKYLNEAILNGYGFGESNPHEKWIYGLFP